MNQLADDNPLQHKQILALLDMILLEGLKEVALQLVKAHQDQPRMLPGPYEEQCSSPENLRSITIQHNKTYKRVKQRSN